ncbi:alpha/beta hydrolase family protein [Paucibacter sp. M5-1]|uniref:alpha/beta hydrolase family protein n=1 Tax=Paucibacter sp. M5-1 TaxID=3015998 RepID=UPI0022B8F514|nr:alpha/beta hydrolase [Paucibacter sp. M5-1]MCZ7880720.1 alpha/beta fold hydrolase [Paucibacter sp. M5-1]
MPQTLTLHTPALAAATPAAEPSVRQRTLQLRCADGRLLAATWFEPAGVPRAIALISPATAVARGFYRGFGEWLAQRGYAVLSYDYRGIGDSLQGPLRQERARLRDWAQLDMGAALRAVQRRRLMEQEAQGRALGLLLVGHSFGGNAIGLAPDYEQADAILGVAAQAADWRFWSGIHKAKVWLFFHAMLPAAGHLLGHAPGWLMGARRAEGLPKGAALEWAAWGRRRGFMFSDPSLQAELGYHRFTGPVHLWNISDDPVFGPAPAVDALAARFSTAQVQRHTLAPADVGLESLGHFAAFRRELGPRIWPRLLAPLEAATPLLAADC